MAAVRHIRNLKNRHNSTATWAPILGVRGQLAPTFRSGGKLMVLRPPLLSDHSDEYCRLVALTYQEDDGMTTLTLIPDLSN